MSKPEMTDRAVGFFKKNLETMTHKKRLEYVNQKLRGSYNTLIKILRLLRTKWIPLD